MAKKHENDAAAEATAETAPVETAPAEAAPVAPAAKNYNFNNLNTLAVVSIATALSGFGAVAGVITGHVALAQLKRDGKQGRGLAIAGLAIGYVGIAFAVIGGVAKIALGIWGVRNGVQFGGQSGFGNFGGGFDGDNHGMMGGQFDQNGQSGQGNMGWNNGGGMMGGQGGQVTVTPNQQNG
ncbi:MAG: hypothetical protein RL605_122 [Actinomycetota bacterium]|jgi:hypothetical protein